MSRWALPGRQMALKVGKAGHVFKTQPDGNFYFKADYRALCPTNVPDTILGVSINPPQRTWQAILFLVP